MRIFLLGVLVVISSKLFCAVSFTDAQKIYNGLIVSNGLRGAPILMYSSSKAINASYGGGRVTINAGMLAITNKDQLAFVLGHELAHWSNSPSRNSWEEELKADHNGAIYAKRAHWDVCVGKTILLKFKKGASRTHPDPIDRYNAIHC